MRHKFVYANALATVAVFVLPALVTATTAWADVRVLPTILIGPEPLAPGTYQTRPGFLPPTTFTVGRGWRGGQGSHTDWVVGKGPNRLGGVYGAVTISGHRTWLPYATAVSRFRALTTLTAGPSKLIQVGGYPAVSFHAVVQHGTIAPTPGLPLSSTVSGVPPGVRAGGEQIFVNVRGKTLLLQIETFARTGVEAAALKRSADGALRTVRFPG